MVRLPAPLPPRQRAPVHRSPLLDDILLLGEGADRDEAADDTLGVHYFTHRDSTTTICR